MAYQKKKPQESNEPKVVPTYTVTLKDVVFTLTHEEAKKLKDRLYLTLNGDLDDEDY